MWENARIYDFIEKFEDFGLKIDTYSFLNQCIKICEYKRSRPFFCLWTRTIIV